MIITFIIIKNSVIMNVVDVIISVYHLERH